LFFDKVLLLMARSIGGLFLRDKGYFASKSRGLRYAVGKGRWSDGHPFKKSVHLLVESPVKKAFLSTIQANHFRTPDVVAFFDFFAVHEISALGLWQVGKAKDVLKKPAPAAPFFDPAATSTLYLGRTGVVDSSTYSPDGQRTAPATASD
jgi:hypothetical protein